MAEPRSTGVIVSSVTGEGAQIEQVYHSSTQDIVGVPVMDLEDAQSSSHEEIFLFAGGNSLAGGSFFLAAEQLITEGAALNSVLFFCGGLAIAGCILIWVGYRQIKRRRARLMRYVPKDKH